MSTNEILDLVLTAAATGALLTPVIALLERTHRRAAADNGGRIGWSTDADDADVRRVHDELRARAGEEPSPRTGTSPARRQRPATTHPRHGVRAA